MLNALRERGQKLLTQNITGEEFDDWKLSVNDWELTTYAVLMSYFDYAESEPFSILKYQLNQKFSHEMNGGHSALLNETAIRINHLTRVLDRYRDFWAPMSEEEQSAVMENLKKIEWVAKGIRANLERKKQI